MPGASATLTERQCLILRRLIQERKAFEFSNFEAWDGTTLEHRYQAVKTQDHEERLWVMSAPTPGEAKRRGKRVTKRLAWDEKKPAYMWRLIVLKFAGGSAFAQRLAESRGEIVEWNVWHDTFWGRCVCSRHLGEGENWLGTLLMLRRAQLWAGVRG